MQVFLPIVNFKCFRAQIVAYIYLFNLANIDVLGTSLAAQCSIPSNSIQTEPVLTKNTVARNFNKLKLWIKFQFQSGQYYWSLPGFTPNQLSIFTQFAPCLEENNETDFVVSCQNVSCNTANYVIGSLTLRFPLDKNVSFAVIRVTSNQDKVQLASINITIKGNSMLLRGGALSC